jgi:hypothetical protein
MDSARLIELAQKHAATSYGSKPAVRAANRAADELRSIVLDALSTAQGTEQLMGLLEQTSAGPWIAFIGLESGRLRPLDTARCLAVVESLAGSSELASIGASTWLAQYKRLA